MPVRKAISKKESLVKKAEENTTITEKVHNSKGKLVEQTVKEGSPNDHANKHDMNKGQADFQPRTIGLSLGVTKNMDNYESLRVDCWLTDTLQEDETQQEGLIRLGEIITEMLAYQVGKIIED